MAGRVLSVVMSPRSVLAMLVFALGGASAFEAHADGPRAPEPRRAPSPSSTKAQPATEDAKLPASSAAATAPPVEPHAADGCASLQRAETSAAHLKLGECYERIGKTASAWVHYVSAATAAASANDTTREHVAKERAGRIAFMVDRIVITPPTLPNVEVERDGRAVPRSEWAKEIPIDPGEHTIHIAAPGKTSFDSLVTARGTGVVMRIDVRELEPALPWRLAPGATTDFKLDSKPDNTPATTNPESKPLTIIAPRSVEPSTARRSLSSLEYWGYGFAIGGLVSLGAGSALYASARSDDGPSSCGDSRCVLSAAFLSTGGAALILGTVLVLVSVTDR